MANVLSLSTQEVIILVGMGNQELCRVQCNRVDPREINPFKESACIEMIDNLPRIKGKFNFNKQTSFNKIERAASQYCSSNSIDRIHIPIVARLIAYQQNHYFEAIRQLPEPQREGFVLNQEEIDIQLMDSLYHQFVVKQKGQAHPRLFLSQSPIIPPPLISLAQIKQEHRRELCGEGLEKIRKGRVALVLMAAGTAESDESTSKALARLPVEGRPTVLQVLMRRYISFLKVEGQSLTQSHSFQSSILRQKGRPTPVIVICSSQNFRGVKTLFEQNAYFGLEKSWVKLEIEERSVPLIGIDGKLCLSEERMTLTRPAGTAITISKVIDSKLKGFLESCCVQYVHFMGCQNICEIPCDPMMVGLMDRFGRQIAGKCVEGGDRHRNYPRYVATKAAFHLLDRDQLRMLQDKALEKEAPIALNSLVFRLSSLIEFYHNFQTNLYIAKRFHMKELNVDHFDFGLGKSIRWARAFSFQQDIRDYLSASPQAIVVKYSNAHFRPISVLEIGQSKEPYREPSLF